MPELLLELLSEEIPARMQARAADDLKRLVCDGLKKAGLAFDNRSIWALRSAPARFTSARFAPLRFAPVKVAEYRSAPCKSIASKFTLLKSHERQYPLNLSNPVFKVGKLDNVTNPYPTNKTRHKPMIVRFIPLSYSCYREATRGATPI